MCHEQSALHVVIKRNLFFTFISENAATAPNGLNFDDNCIAFTVLLYTQCRVSIAIVCSARKEGLDGHRGLHGQWHNFKAQYV